MVFAVFVGFAPGECEFGLADFEEFCPNSFETEERFTYTLERKLQ